MVATVQENQFGVGQGPLCGYNTRPIFGDWRLGRTHFGTLKDIISIIEVTFDLSYLYT